jgi:cystathionine beta-lyase
MFVEYLSIDHQVLSRYGIEYTFVDMTNLIQVEQAIKPNTEVLYVETPSILY